MCRAVLIGWGHPSPSPRIWAHIREYYWSANIDDFFLWTPGIMEDKKFKKSFQCLQKPSATPLRRRIVWLVSYICRQDGAQDRKFATNNSPPPTNALPSTLVLSYSLALGPFSPWAFVLLYFDVFPGRKQKGKLKIKATVPSSVKTWDFSTGPAHLKKRPGKQDLVLHCGCSSCAFVHC
jgi:hypothetical protein